LDRRIVGFRPVPVLDNDLLEPGEEDGTSGACDGDYFRPVLQFGCECVDIQFSTFPASDFDQVAVAFTFLLRQSQLRVDGECPDYQPDGDDILHDGEGGDDFSFFVSGEEQAVVTIRQVGDFPAHVTSRDNGQDQDQSADDRQHLPVQEKSGSDPPGHDPVENGDQVVGDQQR